MRFSQGNQPIEALAADGPDDSLANRIRSGISRRRLEYRDAKLCDRLIEMACKNTIALVQ